MIRTAALHMKGEVIFILRGSGYQSNGEGWTLGENTYWCVECNL